jgi:hypothetical protein
MITASIYFELVEPSGFQRRLVPSQFRVPGVIYYLPFRVEEEIKKPSGNKLRSDYRLLVLLSYLANNYYPDDVRSFSSETLDYLRATRG